VQSALVVEPFPRGNDYQGLKLMWSKTYPPSSQLYVMIGKLVMFNDVYCGFSFIVDVVIEKWRCERILMLRMLLLKNVVVEKCNVECDFGEQILFL
jgi:hypothetical protein